MPDRILRTGAEATLLGPLLMTSPRLTPCQRSATDDRARMLPYFPDPYLSWRRVAEAVTSELRSSCCRYISDTDPISPYLIRTRSRRIYLSYTDPISSSFHSSAACLGTRRTPGRQSRRRAVRAPSLSSAARPMPAPHRYSRVPPPQSPHSRRRRTASKAPGAPHSWSRVHTDSPRVGRPVRGRAYRAQGTLGAISRPRVRTRAAIYLTTQRAPGPGPSNVRFGPRGSWRPWGQSAVCVCVCARACVDGWVVLFV